jgi:PHF5-like protein
MNIFFATKLVDDATEFVALLRLGPTLNCTMAKHHPDLVMCRKQPGIAIGRLCEKCELMLRYMRVAFFTTFDEAISFFSVGNLSNQVMGFVFHARRLSIQPCWYTFATSATMGAWRVGV